MRCLFVNKISFFALAVAMICVTTPTHADDIPVCERSLLVRMTLERAFKKPCEEIGTAELPSLKPRGGWTFDARQLLPGDFSGLAGVTDVEFYRVSADFDTRIIKDLTNLRVLKIGAVDATIPADLLESFVNLEVFILSNPNLTEIPPTLFSKNSQLLNITIHKTQLTEIPPSLFANVERLSYLSLWEGQIQALPAGIFSTNRLLNFVNLDRNMISRVDGDLFSNNSELEYVHLSHNMLTAIPSNFCAKIPKLKGLYLSHNQINTLDAPVCPQANSLQLVDLNFNGLKTLNPKHFTPAHFSTDADLKITDGNPLDDETVAQLERILGDRLQ